MKRKRVWWAFVGVTLADAIGFVYTPLKWVMDRSPDEVSGYDVEYLRWWIRMVPYESSP